MLDILIAFIIVVAIGLPIVTVFNKWKKEMDEADREEVDK